MSHGHASRSLAAVIGVMLMILGLPMNRAVPADHSPSVITAISPDDLDGRALSVLDSSSQHAVLLSGAGNHYVEVSRYKTADGHFGASIKRYERITLRLRHWPIDEFMHLLKGSVVLTDSSGHGHTYSAGDSFVIPRGFDGEWQQLDTVEMVTVSYSPK
jgi:EutQ-like cupin domain